MARATRPGFIPNPGGSIAVPFSQFNNTDGEQFYNTGTQLFLIWNKDATTAAVLTFRSVQDPYGRTGDLAVSTPAAAGGGSMKIAGPFPPEAWNQGGTGLVNVDYTSGTAGSIMAAILQR